MLAPPSTQLWGQNNMTDSITVTLKTSIKTHAGDTSTLTLKEPKARSFFEHGEPFKTRVITEGETDRVEFDYAHKVLALFLQDMTGIDTAILGSIVASDYFALRNAATNLILGVAGSNPTPA
jgi:hypothetical protein